jgi:hypothetical protein
MAEEYWQTWYVIVTAAGCALSFAGRVVLFPSKLSAASWRGPGDRIVDHGSWVRQKERDAAGRRRAI